MVKLQTKKQVRYLSLLFALTYMVSYITRINYGAVLTEMERATQLPRQLLSMAVTGSFITYGAGQIVSGICGDRFSPKKLVSLGLAVTVAMNCLIPLCQNPWQMLAVWCANGFAQAFMWPPMVKMMTSLLSEEDYKTVSVRVSWGSSVGTIFVYLCAPAAISLLGWKWVFWICAAMGAGMLLLWSSSPYQVPVQPRLKKAAGSAAAPRGKLFSPLLVGVMVAIVAQGMLRDGVTTWMPTYICETFHLSSVISILTGVVLPIFGMVSFELALLLYKKKFTNPLLCAGVLFGAGTLAALVLCCFPSGNAVTSVLFSALLTGCMHGVNLILICMVPPYFSRHGNVSTVSGVLNACTYIGSACSTYGIAALSQHAGWQTTLLVWFCIALCGSVICLAFKKPWDRRFAAEKISDTAASE